MRKARKLLFNSELTAAKWMLDLSMKLAEFHLTSEYCRPLPRYSDICTRLESPDF